MWIARNKLEQVTRVKSEGLNERVKAIFDSVVLKHLDITCDEVIRTFRTKKKAAKHHHRYLSQTRNDVQPEKLTDALH